MRAKANYHKNRCLHIMLLKFLITKLRLVGCEFMEKDNFNIQSKNQSIESLPKEPVVAMAYVPYQNPTLIYSAEQGIKRGTLFPCLDKPFVGCEVQKR